MKREAITQFSSRTIALPQENIDTDQIIPARFLTTTSRAGLGAAAFHDWRFDKTGARVENDAFKEDDRDDYAILVAGSNFGCGSSREHAPWALMDFGFKAVISSKIADIFTGNAIKNGLLPIEVDPETHQALLATPGVELTVDLEAQMISTSNGGVNASFQIERFGRRCLLDGVDSLGHLLNQSDAISAFEASHSS